MPIDVRRFGVGNRRPEGPPGTVGVTGQIIHSDRRGVVAELAFARGASLRPHSNPHPTWFVVIEGGGWVAVGDERLRVAAGEAVCFPPSIDHAAWTEGSAMRAIVVELGEGGSDAALLLEGRAVRLLPGEATAGGRGEGSLREDPDRPVPYDAGEGEPV